MGDLAREWPIGKRVSIAVFGAALVAVYAPLIAIALTGVWQKKLLDVPTLVLAVPFMAALGFAGLRTKRPVLVHAIVFLPLLAYEMVGVAVTSYAIPWYLWYPVFTVVFFCPILNVAILNRIRAALDIPWGLKAKHRSP